MDLNASGTNPGTTYSITTGNPGVYHEDRVVVTTVGGVSTSQMFRVYGANFDPTSSKWFFQSSVSTAYATVQNPDGSIHYFTYSGTTGWATSAWQGSNNNTIYNVEDFGAAPGVASSAALVSLFMAMSAAPGLIGGHVRIPQYNFLVVGTSTGIAVPNQVIIQALGTGGTGLGSSNYHFTISDTVGAASVLFSATGSHSTGGTEFRNLSFKWNSPQYPGGGGAPGDTVLNLGFAGCLVYRCTFTDCPTTVNFGSFTGTPSALGSVMTQCHVEYESGPNNATCIIFSGEQCSITRSIIAQTGQGGLNPPHGPSGCTGIAIGGGIKGTEHTVFDGLHLAQWTTCIDYSDFNNVGIGSGCQYTSIVNCQMDGYGLGLSLPHAGSCINMTTATSSDQIYGQRIIGNTMSSSQNSTTANPVILIDTGALGLGGVGGAYNNVQGVDLIGNFIFGNITSDDGVHNGQAQDNAYGVQLNSGDSIRIIGGKISNFGNNKFPGTDGSANICISGGVGSVVISEVDLTPSYANGGSGSTGQGASNFALLMSGTLVGGQSLVRVLNCNMTGFAAPVSVTGTVPSGTLYINNCHGYNDVALAVFFGSASNAPTSSVSASTAGTLTGGKNYYGPSTIFFTVGSGGSVTLNINGLPQVYAANSSNVIYLATPYEPIYFTSVTNLSRFQWTGY